MVLRFDILLHKTNYFQYQVLHKVDSTVLENPSWKLGCFYKKYRKKNVTLRSTFTFLIICISWYKKMIVD